MGTWAVATLPQIAMNFRRKSANGLTIHFVLLWLAGDIANFSGSRLESLSLSPPPRCRFLLAPTSGGRKRLASLHCRRRACALALTILTHTQAPC